MVLAKVFMACRPCRGRSRARGPGSWWSAPPRSCWWASGWPARSARRWAGRAEVSLVRPVVEGHPWWGSRWGARGAELGAWGRRAMASSERGHLLGELAEGGALLVGEGLGGGAL